MKKSSIRILSVILAIVLTVGLVPVKSNAFGYEDIPAPGDPVYVTKEEAAEVLLDQMLQRQETAVVYVYSDKEEDQAMFSWIMNAACAHDGSPCGGDYLQWHRKQYSGHMYYLLTGAGYWYTLVYDIKYYDDAVQEEVLDAAIAELLELLALDGKTDYEKVLAVYDYMTQNITYDYDNLSDEEYVLKYTAYAALIHKTAVCQGYANLFYRLMLELGIDCRIVSGIGNGGAHGWNIVKLDGKYYNVDATWDATYTKAGLPYNFFLRTDENFEDHYRDAQYDSEEFRTQYPMAQTDYVPEEHPQVLPGDASGDGMVDGKDATLILQYAAGWNVQINVTAADVNADTYVDGKDATLLLQYAAGWNINLQAV